jgi:hypothetical protein
VVDKINTNIEKLIFTILQEKLDKESLLKIEPFKWQQIYQRLSNNPTCLIIYSYLKKKNSLDILPQDVKEKWQGIYYSNLKRNILVLEQIKELKHLLKETRIEFILLKGASLIITVYYKDLGIRTFVDIDILVKKSNLSPLKDTLRSSGYTLIKSERDQLLERFAAGELLFSKTGLPHLDIHWEFFLYERYKGIINFSLTDIWRQILTARVDEQEVLVLRPELQILYLSLHLALAHSFSKFIWIYDLFKVAEFYNQEIDWDNVVKKAKQLRIQTPLFYSLKFVQEFFDYQLPDDVLKDIAPSRVKITILSSFVNKQKIINTLNDPYFIKTRFLGQILMTDRARDIPKILKRIFFPSCPWLEYRYKSNYSVLLRLQHISKILSLFIMVLYYLTLKRFSDILKKRIYI